jgi:phosphoglycolate phosphatase-like HAD superfamily hydrolase
VTDTIIFDVDGTLVDSNYQNALAWYRALRRYGITGPADEWTTAKDVQATKPAPDLVQAALDKAHATGAVMIGDSTWDAEAALKLDVPTFAVRTGGFSAEELSAAGAAAVYDSLAAVQADLDRIAG